MRALCKFFSSLKLTVVLLAFSLLLVWAATFEQVQWGVFEVQKRYFESLICLWQWPEQWAGADALRWLRIPLPGGFLLGGLLLINLACAHFRYYRASWKKTGIVLIHAGIALLIVSGFLTAYLQQENYMWIDVGGQSNFIESFRDLDLVFIDNTDATTDTIVSIPVSHLEKGEVISNPALPFTVKTIAYYPNSDVGPKAEFPDAPEITGVAAMADYRVIPQPVVYTTDGANFPSAVLELTTAKGTLGRRFVSLLLDPETLRQNYNTIPPIFQSVVPQTFNLDGHTWEITLRPHREYLPITLRLDKFVHEVYPGTDVPKNYESDVQLINPAAGENRPVLIYMNHPLRYAGLTFYQASVGQGDKSSKLEVVRNPGAPLPYLAVLLVGLGMAVQFITSLLSHLRREKAAADQATGKSPRPGAALGPSKSAVNRSTP